MHRTVGLLEMGECVHYIPVGFDFERLIHPISKEELPADRIILITHKDERDDAARLASNMARNIEDYFEHTPRSVEQRELGRNEMYDYEFLYPWAHREISRELNDGNEVFINISSMPRTVAFAFATAANSLIAERQDEKEDIRHRLHTYYVRPDDYLVLELLRELKKEIKYLSEQEDQQAQERLDRLEGLVQRVNSGGVTEGTKKPPGRDEIYVEFPASPGSEVGTTEEEILRFLHAYDGVVESISELAREMAERDDNEYNDSYRSKIQYNVTRLEEKGYVNRESAGNRTKTTLSTMGRMWVETH